jgi:hypothetical protein
MVDDMALGWSGSCCFSSLGIALMHYRILKREQGRRLDSLYMVIKLDSASMTKTTIAWSLVISPSPPFDDGELCWSPRIAIPSEKSRRAFVFLSVTLVLIVSHM